MTVLQIVAIILMGIFYLTYFSKMFLQRRKGVQTDQIGKGGKPKKLLYTEILMKIATYAVVAVELVSIIFQIQVWESGISWFGVVLAAIGVLLFILSVFTMRDSWRAGIPASDQTELVTTGIYRVSRNPAFLGFDLMYLGLLIAFFNPVHLLFACFAVVMLHLQILQEEAFLIAAFGEEYVVYKKQVGRYLIF